jgi:hypothetical protein
MPSRPCLPACMHILVDARTATEIHPFMQAGHAKKPSHTAAWRVRGQQSIVWLVPNPAAAIKSEKWNVYVWKGASSCAERAPKKQGREKHASPPAQAERQRQFALSFDFYCPCSSAPPAVNPQQHPHRSHHKRASFTCPGRRLGQSLVPLTSDRRHHAKTPTRAPQNGVLFIVITSSSCHKDSLQVAPYCHACSYACACSMPWHGASHDLSIRTDHSGSNRTREGGSPCYRAAKARDTWPHTPRLHAVPGASAEIVRAP